MACISTCPRKKTPAITEWEQRATTDTARIHRCWNSGNYNIGIATGPAGLVVIDLDTAKDGDEPPPAWQLAGVTDGADVFALICEQADQPLPYDTYTVATPSGGLHLYYTAPDGVWLANTAGHRGRGLGWRIDTRAHGGYVVAAGSVIDGSCYRIAESLPVALLPAWLAARLQPTPPPAVPTRATPIAIASDRRGRYLEAALAAEIARIQAAHPGERNHTLYIAAVALGQLVAGGALNESQVQTVLLGAASNHIAAGAYTSTTALNTIRSGLRAGTARPRNLDAL